MNYKEYIIDKKPSPRASRSPKESSPVSQTKIIRGPSPQKRRISQKKKHSTNPKMLAPLASSDFSQEEISSSQECSRAFIGETNSSFHS